MEQLVVGQRRFSTRHVKELSPCLTAQAVVRSAISLSTQRLALVGAKRSMWTLGQPPTEVDPAGTLLKMTFSAQVPSDSPGVLDCAYESKVRVACRESR